MVEDKLHRFTLQGAAIRGEIVRLQHSIDAALQHQHYSSATRALLGQLMAAAALLASSIKIDGLLSLQIKTDAGLLAMAEADSAGGLRAIARGGDPQAQNVDDMLVDGILAITITPKDGRRYQGLVPLQGDGLPASLAHYFDQSEQLASRFWLATQSNDNGQIQVAAMMLQVLPSEPLDDDDWQQAQQLAATVSSVELLNTPEETLLFQLFNHFGVRMMSSEALQFRCSCSAERSLNALRALGEHEARQLVAEQGVVAMDCEFCGQQYRFDAQALAALFNDPGEQGPDSQVLH